MILNKTMTKYKKGFALLYAILLSGALLTIGVILMNIITRQLIFSSINRNSETSYYYLANTGRECLRYYLDFENEKFLTFALDGSITGIVTDSSVDISCKGLSPNSIALKRSGDSNVVTFSTIGSPVVVPGIGLVNLEIKINGYCLMGGPCDNNNGVPELTDLYKYVAQAKGTGDNADRSATRTVTQVWKAPI